MYKIADLKKIIINTLNSNKALDITSIDLSGKSSMADYMIIASGTSSRHIQALSEQVLEQFKKNGVNMIIYANHLFRSTYPNMKATAESILKHKRNIWE